MEPDVDKHEQDRENGPLNVLLHNLVEAESMQYHGISVPVDSREEFLVAKLDGIADFDLEVGHKFNLLVVPIAEFIIALVDRLTVFEELSVAVLEGTSEQEQWANVIDLDIVFTDIFVEHNLEICPNFRVFNSALESVIKLVLGNVLKIIWCQVEEV